MLKTLSSIIYYVYQHKALVFTLVLVLFWSIIKVTRLRGRVRVSQVWSDQQLSLPITCPCCPSSHHLGQQCVVLMRIVICQQHSGDIECCCAVLCCAASLINYFNPGEETVTPDWRHGIKISPLNWICLYHETIAFITSLNWYLKSEPVLPLVVSMVSN